MAVTSNKWWWEGYAALAWSLILWLPLISGSRLAYYVFQINLLLGVAAVLFFISALRRGSPQAKAAAVLAVLVTIVFLRIYVSPR